jgi:hypothetical protein
MRLSFSRTASALLFAAISSTSSSIRLQAQTVPKAAGEIPPAKLSCDYSRQLMVSEVTGQPLDTSIFIFKDRGPH